MMRAVCLTLLAVMACTGLAAAEGVGLGVGAYGGVSFPIIQDDTGGGGVFGLRVPVKVIPLITVEPFYLTSSLNDVDEEIGGITYTRSGFDEKAFGANVLFRFGSFYPFAGVGSYKLERNDEEEIKETGWSFGLGLAIPAGRMLTVDLRGELDAIVTGDTSRKFGNLTAGLTYNFNLGGGGGGGAAEPQSTTPTSQSTPPSGAETGSGAAAGAAGAAGTTAPATGAAPSSAAPADSTQATPPPADQPPPTTPPQSEQTGGQK